MEKTVIKNEIFIKNPIRAVSTLLYNRFISFVAGAFLAFFGSLIASYVAIINIPTELNAQATRIDGLESLVVLQAGKDTEIVERLDIIQDKQDSLDQKLDNTNENLEEMRSLLTDINRFLIAN